MNHQPHHAPPRGAALLLQWLLKDEWDTPLGDYEEYYNELVATVGVRRARWWYRGQVVRLLPDQLAEKTHWGLLMLRNYFLLGFRNLRKNKVAATINIVGLSAAVACCIAVFLFIQEIMPDSDLYIDGDRTFLVGHTVERDEDVQSWGTSPVALGPALAADLPQVDRVVRFAEQEAQVRSGDHPFLETLTFADQGFFDLFDMPLSQGHAASLADPGAIVISAEMAAKYFRDEDALGQTVFVTLGDGTEQSFTVEGVAAPLPRRAGLRFDFLVSYAHRAAARGGGADSWSWATFTAGTFLQLHERSDRARVAEQLDRYVAVQNEANEAWHVQSYFLDNLRRPNLLHAWNIHDRAVAAPPFWEAFGVGLVGLLVLLISCFNYINISLGTAARRLKEIGIRKTVGAEKKQLVLQFMTENLLLCFLALLGGLVLTWAFIVPLVYSMTSMQLQLDLLGNLGLWGFLVGLLVFIGLVSGAYPSLYIASLPPTAIFKGTLRFGQKKALTRTLTTVQFAFTIITICLSLFFVSLDDTLLSGDWGYDKEAALVIPSLSPEQLDTMQREAAQLPGVRQVAAAQHHVGASLNAALISVNGTDQEAAYFGVSPAYLTAMGMRLAAGRGFREGAAASDSNAVVVNQTLVARHGWDAPIGQQLRMNDQSYAVIGVVEDVLLHPLLGKAEPAVFGLAPTSQHSFLAVQVERAAMDQTVAAVRAGWEAAFPEVSFTYHVQEDVFQEISFMIDLSLQISRYLGLFALLISCMGLFGIASQRVAQRIKEVGIRKAMGASPLHVILLVNRDFLIMLGIATLIATPLCYVGLYSMLRLAPIDIPLGIAPFALSNLVLLLLAAASLALQTRRLVKVNPADVLRYE